MAELLNGKALSERLLKRIKERGKDLSLAVVVVGADPVSGSFVRQKEKACEKAGVDFKKYEFGETIEESELKEKIEEIAKESKGLVVQLPLPSGINFQEILNSIPLEKDADVLSEKRFQLFESNESSIFPPVVGAVDYLLKEYSIPLEGKKVVLLGKGRLVGKPLSVWLKNNRADFSVVEKDTENPQNLLKQADILISGVGKPGIIKGEDVKEGAVVIDAGTSLEGGQLKGDVSFEEVSKRARYITPVPGGLGPLTVACLLENLLKLNQ